MKTAHSVQTASPNVDVIVVTYDNVDLLVRCVQSILANTGEPIRLIIVNNGSSLKIEAPKNVVVIDAGKNLGWMGGVNLGIRWSQSHDPAPFIMWMNDDAQVLDHDHGWLTKMLNCFQLDPSVGAVGPTSNAVMGQQTIALQGLPPAIESTRLSGLCFLTRRSIIDEIGLLDENVPGGDDLDYSMRIRDAGYKLCICRRAFLLHHYAQTGRKVHGAYWDSREHSESINNHLIKKHGFRKWFNCVSDRLDNGPTGYNFVAAEERLALEELQPYLDRGDVILDLGCGGKKMHPKMIGVDCAKMASSESGPISISPLSRIWKRMFSICRFQINPWTPFFRNICLSMSSILLRRSPSGKGC